MLRLKHLVLVGLLCSGYPIFAQGLSTASSDEPTPHRATKPPATPPIASASRVEEPPLIDGDVLNDHAWADARRVTGFWQITPNEGKPSTEKTEVRIIYTSENIYFGVICYDRSPQSIVNTDSRRDSPLNDTDSFQIILDTYLDHQNGFVFGTNPSGIEYDGQVVKEGQGTGGLAGAGGRRQQGGSGGGFNLNWDGSWEVRTQISEFGWSAEFAIPFRTLRFPGKRYQTWGLNLQRNIRRRNETAFWAPLTRQFNLFRLSEAGTLADLEIPSQRNLKVIPYALGLFRQRGGNIDRRTNWIGDTGLDVKYSLTPSLTLDVTYNTDFAQVEVDEQQINLNRFNLFFPEKRPFFLENSGLFSVGSPGEVELFFSRRIGIGPSGEAIPILGGARVSGKISGTQIGFLNMQTEETGGVTAATNFTVARISRDLPNRSGIGAIFTNRQSTGQLAADDDYGRTLGFDGRWGIGQYGQVSGFLAKTSTPGIADHQHAFKIGSSYNSPAWNLNANFTEVADNFNPEVGFLQRKGFRRVDFLIFHRYRPRHFLGLHELRPHVSYRAFWNFEGFQETGRWHMDNHWEWKSGAQIHTGVNLTREGVTTPFEIFPGIMVPAGTYDHKELQLVAFSNRSAPLSFSLNTTIGGFFGGDRIALRPSMRWRRGETFNIDVSLNRNDIKLPTGSFKTNLARMRISYSFTPRMFIQSLIQYNDRDDNWSMNFRFALLKASNTGLFVVYNEIRDFGDSGFSIPDRSLTIKFSRLFDLLN